MKQKKNRFLIANPPERFSTNRDKMYPMPTVKYTAGCIMLWDCFSAGGPAHLIQIHGIMDFIKGSVCLCKKSYNGPWLDLLSGQ